MLRTVKMSRQFVVDLELVEAGAVQDVPLVIPGALPQGHDRVALVVDADSIGAPSLQSSDIVPMELKNALSVLWALTVLLEEKRHE